MLLIYSVTILSVLGYVAPAFASSEDVTAEMLLRRQDIMPSPKPLNHPVQELPPNITEAEIRDAEPPRDPANVQNWFGTSLYGFYKCGDSRAAIVQAYKDANKIVNLDGVKSNIRWDSAAAMEYLGPEATNKDQQKQIQAVFANVATVYDGWAPRPFANWILVRCDDPRKRCKSECSKTQGVEDEEGGAMRAYSSNPSKLYPKAEWPMINFCPPFFEMRSLTEAVNEFKHSADPNKKFNTENYISRASTFLHELFHLDLAADSVQGTPNPKVRDLKISYFFVNTDGNWDLTPLHKAYGSMRAKILARFVPMAWDKPTGYFVQRNDDNLGRFALSKYVESQIGAYPFLPQIYHKIHDIQEPGPRPDSIGVSWLEDQEKGVVLNFTSVADAIAFTDDGENCSDDDDEQDPVEDSFKPRAPHPDSSYPEWYHDAQKKWFDTIEQASPAGSCSLNITQIWTCEPVDSNLYARVTIKNSTGDLLYSTPGSTRTPGQPINDRAPLELQKGGMKDKLKIVGEHVNDYIQFYYGSASWTSWTTEGSAKCKLVGDNWKKDGPGNCPTMAITRQFECQYPC